MKIVLGLMLAGSMLAAQNANDTAETHVAVAKALQVRIIRICQEIYKGYRRMRHIPPDAAVIKGRFGRLRPIGPANER